MGGEIEARPPADAYYLALAAEAIVELHRCKPSKEVALIFCGDDEVPVAWPTTQARCMIRTMNHLGARWLGVCEVPAAAEVLAAWT